MRNEKGSVLITLVSLVGLLIISTGIMSYNKTVNAVRSSTSAMEQQEIELFNSTIENYVGDNVSGVQVKQMINSIISQNIQYAGEDGKFIVIDASSLSNFDDTSLSDESDEKEKDKTQEKITAATTKKRKVTNTIVTSDSYEIEAFEESNGIITEVSIYEK